MPHAGRILIENLEAQDVTAIFTVPGESFLAALDGMHGSSAIKPVVCRQEGGASMMADAWGKLTGAPGVCFVTRGPGIANAMSGLHIAQQDSTPMVLFVGLPAMPFEDRETFQEFDVTGLLGTFVKWSAVVRDARRIGEYVSRAFHVAQSGRPGPVVLGMPEDMLSAEVEAVPPVAKAVPAMAAPAPDTLRACADALGAAERPLVLVGGPGWTDAARQDLEAFAAGAGLPVAATLRAQDYMDNAHDNYVGHAGISADAKLAQAVRDADVILTIGARLGEMTTAGYTLVESPQPKQSLIHVHPNPSELGTVYRADLPIAASTPAFIAALREQNMPAPSTDRQSRTAFLREAYLTSLEPLGTPGDVEPDAVMAALSRAVPRDTIICNGAGNYVAFLHKYVQFNTYRSQLAPTSGSMGYGLPAAIAAKIAAPERPVIAVAGDGCFMMTAQELATAMHYDVPIVTIIFDNGMYGTIRMHQERDYPERVVATRLTNPDWAAFAQSFGAHGAWVERTDEFVPALEAALAHKGPSVIACRIDPEALTPRQTLSQVRAS
ncbi:MAG: thiamine pyrophosphate-dependent enzyme [Pseudomonadota bacterium]